MKNILFHSDEQFANGFFLEGWFNSGQNGKLTIYCFEQLKSVPVDDRHDTVSVKIVGGVYYEAAQEPANWGWLDKARPPRKRGSVTTYLPYDFEQLRLIETSGGRFLSLKHPQPNDLYRISNSSLKKGSALNIGMVLQDDQELIDFLEFFLPLIGVPPADFPQIKTEIISKVATPVPVT